MKYGKNALYSYHSPNKLFAIGDVHGEKAKLENLLGKLKPLLNPQDCLVFCGDLVDRGPDSPGVLKLIRDFKLNSNCCREQADVGGEPRCECERLVGPSLAQGYRLQ